MLHVTARSFIIRVTIKRHIKSVNLDQLMYTLYELHLRTCIQSFFFQFNNFITVTRMLDKCLS